METICYVRANSEGELEFSEEDQTHWKHKWTKDVVTYQLQKDSEDIEGTSIEKRGVNLAMSTWNFEIPLKLRSTRDGNPDVYINFVHAKNDKFFKLDEVKDVQVLVTKAKGKKCSRCWKILESPCQRNNCGLKN